MQTTKHSSQKEFLITNRILPHSQGNFSPISNDKFKASEISDCSNNENCVWKRKWIQLIQQTDKLKKEMLEVGLFPCNQKIFVGDQEPPGVV